MSHNVDLLRKLAEPKFLDKQGAQAALDAVLAKDPANLSELRKGFADHKAFWATVFEPALPLDDIKDNDSFLNGATTTTALVQSIAHNRAKLGLRTATTAVLEGIITADENGVRGKFFNDPATKAIGGAQLVTRLTGKTASQEIIENTAAQDIQIEAQYQLLSKRIKAIQKDQQLNPEPAGKYFADIFQALNSGDDANFQAKLNSLNDPADPRLRAYPQFSPSVVGKMTKANVGARIKNEIALENFRRNIGLIDDFIKNNLDDIPTTLNKDLTKPATLTEFTQGLPPSYRGLTLTAEEAKPFKEILGERYLIEHVIASKDKDGLERLIKTTDLIGLRNALGNVSTDSYLTTAVHQGNAAKLREEAASRLLIERIQEIDDEDALKALRDVRNTSNLEDVLEKHGILNLDGTDNAAIREAFKGHSLGNVIAAAHVRLSLLKSNDIAKLKTVITEPSADPMAFAQNFITRFPMQGRALPSGVDVSILTNYFKNSNNVLQARRQALLSAAKAKFESREVTADGLDAAIPKKIDEIDKFLAFTAKSLGLSLDQIQDLLDSKEKEQFRGKPELLSRKLVAYAAAAQNIKYYEERNLNNNSDYNEIIADINKLHSTPGFYLVPLSDLEKDDLAVRLTAIIIKQNLDSKKDELQTLSTANSIQEFKDALTELKITNHTWVNEKTMESVQKAAVQGVISQKIQSITKLNDSAYPALNDFIKTLSLKHHKELLQPDFLNQLLASRDVDDIKARLHCKRADAKKILGDFKNIDRINSIQNPAIAAQLLKMPNIPFLTKTQVNAINERLAEKDPAAAGASFSRKLQFDGSYNSDLNALFGGLGLSDTVERSIKNALKKPGVPLEVSNNRKFNFHLAAYNHTNAGQSMLAKSNRAVINFLQTLEKGDQFKKNDIPIILGHFRQATSREKLIEDIKTMGLPRVTFDSLEKEINTRRFEEFKRNFKKANLLEDIKDTTKADPKFDTLDASVKEVKDLFSKISRSSSRIREDLDALGRLDVMEWLNPAFQASVAQYAHEMLPKMQELAQGCDVLVTQLQHQYDTINKELNDLPTKKEIDNELSHGLEYLTNPVHKKRVDELEKKIAELTQLRADIEKNLDRYKKVQRMLNGDPDGNEFIQKGALKVLEEAKDVKHSVQFLSYKSAYTDYPMSELKNHLGSTWKGKDVDDHISRISSASVPANGKQPTYELVKKVADGEFREHTIGTGKAKGLFIEQRSAQDMATKREKDGSYSVNPSVSILMTQFPAKEIVPGTTDKETAESQQARITYGFAVANQILSTLNGRAPTADNPIVLKGLDSCSKEELPYVWTALMLIGKENPHLRFGKEAIVVRCPYFDPHNELNFVGRFSGESHFKKVFEPNKTVYKDLLNQMTDYQADKSHTYEAKKKQVARAVSTVKDEFKDESTGNALTRLFKTKFQSTIKESAEKNEAKEQDPQATKRMKLS
ncbi:interaptin [Legionella beliardensis]|uniref:Interaptin n=1 Tax=Legionella beliardensis TaxID=91822 RepID=A0A378I3S2_9GAMM|nr:hypothetical protein [Legionella beliardensis]STX29643.1 interaptin [Legionella beliardensis]